MKPTTETYQEMQQAYDHFNRALFRSTLPECLITLQRHKGAYGYFCPERFVSAVGEEKTDEIALNPSCFNRPIDEILSTLVHEMAHLWQKHFGEPGRGRYHNDQWAAKMTQIGLMPSDTGAPGGRRTGDQMSHYILADGPYARACHKLLNTGFVLPWRDRFCVSKGGEGKGGDREGADKSNRLKYTCPHCGLNVWGKPEIQVRCGSCEDYPVMVA